jgi:hypothetical protein
VTEGGKEGDFHHSDAESAKGECREICTVPLEFKEKAGRKKRPANVDDKGERQADRKRQPP